MKNTFIICSFFLVCSLYSWAQQLSYKSGNIYDSNNQKLKTTEVEELMSKDVKALDLYKTGTSKSIWSSVLVAGGAGLLVGDLIKSVSTSVLYPTALTYIGLGSIAVSIPVSLHHNNNIKKAVDAYNQYINGSKTTFLIKKLLLSPTKTGLGCN